MFMFISTKGLMSEATLECFMYWDMHVTRLPFPTSDSFQSVCIICFSLTGMEKKCNEGLCHLHNNHTCLVSEALSTEEDV